MSRLKLEHRDTCRICGEKHLTKIVNWESIPLSADVLDEISIKGSGEDCYPLDVYLCEECGHVQLLDIIDAEIYENYLYTPSFSREFLDYVSALALEIVDKYGPCKVIEIGSSDGLLLKHLQDKSCQVLGFEPSSCLAERAIKQYQVHTRNAYFSNNEETATYIESNMGKADLFIIRHVLEHLDDLDMIIQGIYENLSEDGSLIIEVPYLKNIIQENQFYAFFHEHLSYFSLHVLNKLLLKNEFIITNVKTGKLEGGSIIVYASKNKESNVDKEVDSILEEEGRILSIKEIKKFSKSIHSCIYSINTFVDGMVSQQVKLAAWGAGQRAVTLLNACGLTSEKIQYVIDVNENYQGKYLPGCHIPVVSPKVLEKSPVDGIIVFATGYMESIIKSNKEFIASGGRFIRIIPTIEWVEN